MEKKLKYIFDSNKLEVNDDNFKSIIASLLCNKHKIKLEELNDVLNQEFEYIDSKEVMNQELYSVFDSFMMNARREKTGSYYTPYKLAEKMVQMSFHDFFDKNGFEENLNFFYRPFFYEENNNFINTLKTIKIADIACGTGVFLIASIQVMIGYYKALNQPYNMSDLINQVYGADIQETPLLLLNLFLMDLLLDNNHEIRKCQLKLGDTILDYGNEVKFDIVIGNPPYVGEKGNKALFDLYKKTDGYEARMDLFYFFIYKGYDLLTQRGILSYITTNYWVTADGAKYLRSFIKDKTRFIRLINLDECKLFSDAKGMHNLIFTFAKSFDKKTSVQIIKQTKVKSLDILYDNQYKLDHLKMFSEKGNIILYEKMLFYPIVEKMLSKSSLTLEEVADVNQGIVSGADKVTKRILEQKLSLDTINSHDLKDGDPIFVFDEKPFDSEFFKPFYKNGQIKPYKMSLKDHKWILYIKNDDINESYKEWEHLLPFKTLLMDRREVKSGTRDWYALQWGRHHELFDGEKIVVPQRASINKFAYTNMPFYSSADVYYITKGPLKFLLGLLNSKIYYFWFYNRGKRKGKSLELYAKPLSQVPIPSMSYEVVADHVENILNGNMKSVDEIDQLLYKYFELTPLEINEVELLYNRGKNEKKVKS